MSETTVENKAVATTPKPLMLSGGAPRAVVPASLEDVRRMAAVMVQAGQFGRPRDADDTAAKIAQASIVLLQGLELSLTPMQALNGIAIISGRPSVWGKLARALVLRAGHRIDEWVENDGDEEKQINFCKITRGDTGAETVRKFSIKDAKRAKLWSPDEQVKRFNKWEKKDEIVDNDSPWHKYWPRMMQHRPFAYCAADACPEALLGMPTAEEMRDMQDHEAERDRGDITPVVAPPPPPAAQTEPETPTATDAMTTVALMVEPDAPVVPEQKQDDPEVEAAATACVMAMGTAKTVARLDQLKEALDAKFDGRISGAIEIEVGTAYDVAAERINSEAAK